MIGALGINADNYYRAYMVCNMEYIAVLNNYLEYSLCDNHTVNNLSFQRTSMHVFHAAVSIKRCVGKDMIWFFYFSSCL